MRILHVSPYYEEAWAYGGIPRVVAAQARALGRRGHQLVVATTDACDRSSRLPAPSSRNRSNRAEDGAVPSAGKAWTQRGTDDVEVRVFPNLSNWLAYHQQLYIPLGLRQYLRAHAADFDLAHLHGCRHFLGVLAARELQRVGVPYLLQPDGTAPLIERRRLRKRLFDLLGGASVVTGSAGVIAITEAERRQLAGLGIRRRVRVVPNPLSRDDLEATPDPEGIRQRFMTGGRKGTRDMPWPG